MITAVCLNPCIDKTITVDGVALGEHNRIIDTQTDIAGKGVNVAVLLKRLDMPVRLIGFNFKDNAELLENLLSQEEIAGEFVTVNGELRTNIKLLDISANTVTELNETGSYVSREKIDELLKLLDEYCVDSDLLILSGSMPVGCDDTLYKEIIQRAGCRCVLDCAGESLARALEAAPFMIKPNKAELEQYVGKSLDTPEACLAEALKLVQKGIHVVCVSMGGDGAIITNGMQAYYAPPVKVRVNSTVGAGDSMVAGICKGIEEGENLRECLAMGVAAATACVLNNGTSLPDAEMYSSMLARVQIEQMTVSQQEENNEI